MLIALLGIILVAGTGFGVWWWQQSKLKIQRINSEERILRSENELVMSRYGFSLDLPDGSSMEELKSIHAMILYSKEIPRPKCPKLTNCSFQTRDNILGIAVKDNTGTGLSESYKLSNSYEEKEIVSTKEMVKTTDKDALKAVFCNDNSYDKECHTEYIFSNNNRFYFFRSYEGQEKLSEDIIKTLKFTN